MKSGQFSPMNGVKLDALPQHCITIRGRGITRSGSLSPNFLYARAADGDVAGLVENQRPILLAGEAADD